MRNRLPSVGLGWRSERRGVGPPVTGEIRHRRADAAHARHSYSVSRLAFASAACGPKDKAHDAEARQGERGGLRDGRDEREAAVVVWAVDVPDRRPDASGNVDGKRMELMSEPSNCPRIG